MEFFNRKEEVLDIQLTQYGKHLLSKGKFKPKFYAFYDGDLIYDSNYGGFSEFQSETEDRLKETSRIKAQHAFEGADTRIKKITQTEATINLDIDEKAMLLQQFQPTQTRMYGLSGQLGTSALTSHKAPAWNIRLLEGEFSDTNPNYSGSIRVDLIPQLDVVLETIVKPTQGESGFDEYDDVGDSALNTFLADSELQMAQEFPDGSGYKISSDTLIAEIKEANSPNSKINFDIEIFEVEEDENGNEELKLLKFNRNRNSRLKKDLAMTVTGPDFSKSTQRPQENKMFSEYYMGISLDGSVERPAISTTQAPVPAPTLPKIAPDIPVNSFVCPEEVNAFEVDEAISETSTGGSGTSGGGSGGGGGY